MATMALKEGAPSPLRRRSLTVKASHKDARAATDNKMGAHPPLRRRSLTVEACDRLAMGNTNPAGVVPLRKRSQTVDVFHSDDDRLTLESPIAMVRAESYGNPKSKRM